MLLFDVREGFVANVRAAWEYFTRPRAFATRPDVLQAKVFAPWVALTWSLGFLLLCSNAVNLWVGPDLLAHIRGLTPRKRVIRYDFDPDADPNSKIPYAKPGGRVVTGDPSVEPVTSVEWGAQLLWGVRIGTTYTSKVSGVDAPTTVVIDGPDEVSVVCRPEDVESGAFEFHVNQLSLGNGFAKISFDGLLWDSLSGPAVTLIALLYAVTLALNTLAACWPLRRRGTWRRFLRLGLLSFAYEISCFTVLDVLGALGSRATGHAELGIQGLLTVCVYGLAFVFVARSRWLVAAEHFGIAGRRMLWSIPLGLAANAVLVAPLHIAGCWMIVRLRETFGALL